MSEVCVRVLIFDLVVSEAAIGPELVLDDGCTEVDAPVGDVVRVVRLVTSLEPRISHKLVG